MFIRLSVHLLDRRHQRSIIHHQGAKPAKGTPGSFGSAFICLIGVISVPSFTDRSPSAPGQSQAHFEQRSSATSASSAFHYPPPRRQARQGHARFIRLSVHLLHPLHPRYNSTSTAPTTKGALADAFLNAPPRL